MNVKAICQKCKESFDVSEENLVYQKEFMYDGQSIFLTYFDCPKCGRRHFVQIDDQKSKELLERDINTLVREYGKLGVKTSFEEIWEYVAPKF